MNDQELLDLKQKIEEAKANISRNEGRRDALMEQLQEHFGITTLTEANKKIKALEAEIEVWDQRIEAATEQLERDINERTNPETTQPTRTRERETSADPGGRSRTPRTTPRQ